MRRNQQPFRPFPMELLRDNFWIKDDLWTRLLFIMALLGHKTNILADKRTAEVCICWVVADGCL
jgi:hypothetical protein